MNPATAIAPMKMVRRNGRKRWHLWDFHGDGGDRTFCGQTIGFPKKSTAYNAQQITCTDCVVAAIRRKA